MHPLPLACAPFRFTLAVTLQPLEASLDCFFFGVETESRLIMNGSDVNLELVIEIKPLYTKVSSETSTLGTEE